MTADRKKKYENKRLIKKVSFNAENDKELIKLAESIPDFSNWVKDRLREQLPTSKAQH